MYHKQEGHLLSNFLLSDLIELFISIFSDEIIAYSCFLTPFMPEYLPFAEKKEFKHATSLTYISEIYPGYYKNFDELHYTGHSIFHTKF